VGGWDPQVLQEPHDLATVGLRPLQQAHAGERRGGAAGRVGGVAGVGGGAGGEDAVVAVLQVFGELAPHPVEVAFEASYGWSWFPDCWPMPASPPTWPIRWPPRPSRRRVKNDAVDAKTLAHLLRTNLAGGGLDRSTGRPPGPPAGSDPGRAGPHTLALVAVALDAPGPLVATVAAACGLAFLGTSAALDVRRVQRMNRRYVSLFPASDATGTGRGDSQAVAEEAQA
jgi:hypothetical protein